LTNEAHVQRGARRKVNEQAHVMRDQVNLSTAPDAAARAHTLAVSEIEPVLGLARTLMRIHRENASIELDCPATEVSRRARDLAR
jgi:hypothetical protein